MPKAQPRKSTVDRSSAVAYIGVGAAIAFIAAMTFGAIDTPTEYDTLSMTAQADGPTQFPAANTWSGEAQAR